MTNSIWYKYSDLFGLFFSPHKESKYNINAK